VTTDYDGIAAEYKRSKQQPWRFYIERYTLLGLIGDLHGLSVLDLACGEGYYTRELRHRGADRVVGVDLSEGMIQLARNEEARKPLRIEYRLGDARALDGSETFDLVVAAYLLNYASTKEELQRMCAAIARALKPGHRFVSVNNNPEQPIESFAVSRKYGFVKSTPGELHEGAPITYSIFLEGGSFDVTNYWLSPATHEEAFRQAGFREFHWHRPRLSPQGREAFGDEFWESFLAHPAVTFLECVR
jgi:SAM-dependent methyltransferase